MFASEALANALKNHEVYISAELLPTSPHISDAKAPQEASKLGFNNQELGSSDLQAGLLVNIFIMKACWSVAENKWQGQKQHDLLELGKGPPASPYHRITGLFQIQLYQQVMIIFPEWVVVSAQGSERERAERDEPSNEIFPAQRNIAVCLGTAGKS